MPASKEVKKLIFVANLIHRDCENVLFRVLIVHDEVRCIVAFEGISGLGYLVTAGNASLKGIELMTVDGEFQRLISKINLMIEQDFGQQEIGHRARKAAIIVTFMVAMGIGKIGNCGLKFGNKRRCHVLSC